MKISVDVGYSSVKAVSDTGKRIIFPSIIAPYRENPVNGTIYSQYKRHVLSMNGEKSLVGDAAIRSLTGISSMDREKPVELHDLFILAAAYLCDGHMVSVGQDEITLGVGLPFAYYRSQKDELKNRLQRLEADIQVDHGPESHISFQDVSVYPQGLGLLFGVPSLPQSGFVGLIDIGCFTTDYMLFVMEDGEPVPIPDACGSIEAGTYLVQQDISAGFLSQTGAPLAYFMYRDALRAAQKNLPISFHSKDVHLSTVYQHSVQKTAQLILENIKSVWVSRTEYLTLTAFAGGGAEMFRAHTNSFPGSIIINNPVFANADGFLKLLAD